METSSEKKQKELTIEARHTISLAISKLRRQKYSTSIFIPRKRLLRKTMNTAQKSEIKSQFSGLKTNHLYYKTSTVSTEKPQLVKKSITSKKRLSNKGKRKINNKFLKPKVSKSSSNQESVEAMNRDFCPEQSLCGDKAKAEESNEIQRELSNANTAKFKQQKHKPLQRRLTVSEPEKTCRRITNRRLTMTKPFGLKEQLTEANKNNILDSKVVSKENDFGEVTFSIALHDEKKKSLSESSEITDMKPKRILQRRATICKSGLSSSRRTEIEVLAARLTKTNRSAISDHWDYTENNKYSSPSSDILGADILSNRNSQEPLNVVEPLDKSLEEIPDKISSMEPTTQAASSVNFSQINERLNQSKRRASIYGALVESLKETQIKDVSMLTKGKSGSRDQNSSENKTSTFSMADLKTVEKTNAPILQNQKGMREDLEGTSQKFIEIPSTDSSMTDPSSQLDILYQHQNEDNNEITNNEQIPQQKQISASLHANLDAHSLTDNTNEGENEQLSSKDTTFPTESYNLSHDVKENTEKSSRKRRNHSETLNIVAATKYPNLNVATENYQYCWPYPQGTPQSESVCHQRQQFVRFQPWFHNEELTTTVNNEKGEHFSRKILSNCKTVHEPFPSSEGVRSSQNFNVDTNSPGKTCAPYLNENKSPKTSEKSHQPFVQTAEQQHQFQPKPMNFQLGFYKDTLSYNTDSSKSNPNNLSKKQNTVSASFGLGDDQRYRKKHLVDMSKVEAVNSSQQVQNLNDTTDNMHLLRLHGQFPQPQNQFSQSYMHDMPFHHNKVQSLSYPTVQNHNDPRRSQRRVNDLKAASYNSGDSIQSNVFMPSQGPNDIVHQKSLRNSPNTNVSTHGVNPKPKQISQRRALADSSVHCVTQAETIISQPPSFLEAFQDLRRIAPEVTLRYSPNSYLSTNSTQHETRPKPQKQSKVVGHPVNNSIQPMSNSVHPHHIWQPNLQGFRHLEPQSAYRHSTNWGLSTESVNNESNQISQRHESRIQPTLNHSQHQSFLRPTHQGLRQPDYQPGIRCAPVPIPQGQGNVPEPCLPTFNPYQSYYHFQPLLDLQHPLPQNQLNNNYQSNYQITLSHLWHNATTHVQSLLNFLQSTETARN